MRRALSRNKAQVAPFMTIVMVIIILAIGATMLIGELAYRKARLSNIVDSTVISAGTELARSLNLIRQIHYRLQLNDLKLQVALLSRGIWPDKPTAEAFALVYAMGIYTGKKLFSQAEEIAKDLPKQIRSSLYDRILGGVVDEPKPFTYQEGTKILDYSAYLNREPPFSEAFRAYKKTNQNWWQEDIYSYSWNKTAKAGRIERGQIKAGEPVYEFSAGGQERGYDSYARVELLKAPDRVIVEPQEGVLFFVFWCGPSVCPGFLPNPYAAISRIAISPSNTFGAEVKYMPFRTFPYFFPEPKEETAQEERQKREIGQSAKIRITGDIWTGYDIRMEQ